MPKKTTIIPKAATARILVNAGAKRVSDDAAKAFAEVLEERAEEIAQKAARIARHSGRKTVLDSDIKLAVK